MEAKHLQNFLNNPRILSLALFLLLEILLYNAGRHCITMYNRRGHSNKVFKDEMGKAGLISFKISMTAKIKFESGSVPGQSSHFSTTLK